jgi:hypothetical protein
VAPICEYCYAYGYFANWMTEGRPLLPINDARRTLRVERLALGTRGLITLSKIFKKSFQPNVMARIGRLENRKVHLSSDKWKNSNKGSFQH